MIDGDYNKKQTNPGDIRVRAQLSSGARGLSFLGLQVSPLFVYASSEGYDESAPMRRLI